MQTFIFAKLVKTSFANIYLCGPIFGKVSRTFIFANQRRTYRILKTCFPLNLNCGHLPREISCATKFLLDREPNVAHLSSTHYCRSPLLQGGLEIPCTVKVWFPASIKDDMLIGKYKEIVQKFIYPTKEWSYLLAVSSKGKIITKTKLDCLANEAKKEQCFKKIKAKESMEQKINERYPNLSQNYGKMRKWQKRATSTEWACWYHQYWLKRCCKCSDLFLWEMGKSNKKSFFFCKH